METTLQANKGRYDAVVPLGASLLFHALLIAVLNGTSSFDFTVGNETRFDILWFGPADLASSSAQAVKGIASAAAPPAQQPADSRGDQDDPDSSSQVPIETVMENSATSSAPAMAVTEALTLPIPAEAEGKRRSAVKRPTEPARTETRRTFLAATHGTASQSEKEKEKHATHLPGQPEITKKPERIASGTLSASSTGAEEKERAKRAKMERLDLETAAGKEQASPPQLEVFQILPTTAAHPVSADEVARKMTPIQAAPKVMPASAPPLRIAAAAKPSAPPPAKAAAPKALKSAAPASMTPTAIQPQTTVKSLPHVTVKSPPQATVKALPPATVKAATPRAATSATAVAKPPGTLPIMAKVSAAPAPAASPPLPAPAAAKKATVERADGKAAAANQEGGKGVVLSSLKGDLKLVLAGDPALRLTVSFREFPKSRRNRAQNKAEARNLKRVQPIFAKNGRQAREAVIGTAREGVYIFAVEPEHAAPAQGSFTLKLYESGAREKVISIGTRTVSSRTIIARVLMPEGILWDDDSAFSGSMEDSDSTTKFNTRTGLYWKEYND